MIERRDPDRGEYYEMPQPESVMAGHTRWLVHVPPSGETSFPIRIRNVYENKENIDDWDIAFIEELQTAGLLTKDIYLRLKHLWDEKQQETATVNQVKSLQSEYEQVVSRQEQLRKNLAVLGTSEREVVIRNHILDDLEASENRRRELEKKITELDAQAKQHRQTQLSLINEIYTTLVSGKPVTAGGWQHPARNTQKGLLSRKKTGN